MEQERRKRVRLLIAQLELSYIDVAELWGVKHGTVKNYLSKAVDQHPTIEQVEILENLNGKELSNEECD